MVRDEQSARDERTPAPLERGDLLSSIERWALLGYRREVGGDDAEFERRWREAFHADVPAAAGGGKG